MTVNELANEVLNTLKAGFVCDALRSNIRLKAPSCTEDEYNAALESAWYWFRQEAAAHSRDIAYEISDSQEVADEEWRRVMKDDFHFGMAAKSYWEHLENIRFSKELEKKWNTV